MKSIGVCLVTYNEEKYIAQAIESVLFQECDANVVLYIGNDCSTDNTTEICRDYARQYPLRVVLLEHEHNLGLVANTKSVLEKITLDGNDYIAMLDGDDYWCDSQKLQKQFTFLENNDDYGFVHTNQRILFNDEILESEPRNDVKEGMIFEWAGTRQTAVANCTAFFRTSLLDLCDLNDFISYGFKSVDYPMYIIFMKYVKFHFMPDFTAVWRRGHCSVSGGGSIEKQIAYLENGIQQWKYLSTLFPNRWPYTEENGEKYRKRHILKLAYQYGEYEYAHEAAAVKFAPKGITEVVQRLCAKRKLFFMIVYSLHYKKKF